MQKSVLIACGTPCCRVLQKLGVSFEGRTDKFKNTNPIEKYIYVDTCKYCSGNPFAASAEGNICYAFHDLLFFPRHSLLIACHELDCSCVREK